MGGAGGGAGGGAAGTAAGTAEEAGDGPGWWRVRCGLRQGEPAHLVAAAVRRAAGRGALGPGVEGRALGMLLHDPALAARGLRPGRAYAERVLNSLAKEAAADGAELCEDLVTSLARGPLEAGAGARGGAAEAPPEGWCFKTYTHGGDGADLCAADLTLALSLNLFEGSTGCHAWEAGFFLCEFVLSQRGRFRGRRCLELGCGPGAVGVALVRAGAAQVVLTDGDAETVQNAHRNMGLNGVIVSQAVKGPGGDGGDGGIEVSCEKLLWEAPETVEADVVLGADLLYDPLVIPDLVALLSRARTPSGAPAEAFIATAVRNEATLTEFLRAAAAAGLAVEDLSAEARCSNVKFAHHLTLARDAVRLHRLIPSKSKE